jgi:hypothetical protein
MKSRLALLGLVAGVCRRAKHIAAFLILFLGFQCGEAHGQVVATWTDSSGNWSNPANWSTNPVVPNNGGGTTYSVIIGTSNSVVAMDVLNVTIDNLTLGGANALNIFGNSLSLVSGASSTSGGIGNEGTLNNASGAALTINSGGALDNIGTPFNNYGTVTNSGTINNLAGTGTTNNFGTFTNTFGASITQVLDGGRLLNAAGAHLTNYGTITTVDGSFQNAGTLTNYGTLNNVYDSAVDNSGTLTNYGIIGGVGNSGTLTNYGTINTLYGAVGISNGIANFSGTLDNSGGTIFIDSAGVLTNFNTGTLINAGALTNNGTLTNASTFNNTVHGNLNNVGTLNNSGTFRNTGTIINAGTINNTGTFRNSGAVSITSTGLFTTSTDYTQTRGSTRVDGTLTATGGAIVDIKRGVLSGTGTINGNVLMGGKLMPGDGVPGTLTIFGDYEQTHTGTFDELLSPSSHSLLDVNGNAVLDHGSELEIALLNGFNPIDQTFDIMNYSSLTGVFANGSSFWDDGFLWDVSYGPNQIDITAVQAKVADPASQAPEPGSLLLLGVGLTGLAWRRLRS